MEEVVEEVEEDVLSTGERWSSCASACCVSTSTVSPPSLPPRPGQTGVTGKVEDGCLIILFC